MNTRHLLAAPVLALLLSASLLHAQDITFTPVVQFSYPGAFSTLASGLDDAGNVVGGYVLPGDDYASGFQRFADGTFSPPLAYPGAGVYQTFPTAINNHGLIAGWYDDNSGAHGFFLSHGVYTTFDHPAADSFTLIYGINDAGDFVGVYATVNGGSHAFASIGGQLTELAIPGSTYIEPHDINNSKAITGWYNTRKTSSGFILQSDGTLRAPIRPPDASAVFFGSNDTQASVGQQNGTLGFYYGRGQNFATYSYPGLDFNSFTGINQRGLICGTGYDSVAERGYSYLVRRSR